MYQDETLQKLIDQQKLAKAEAMQAAQRIWNEMTSSEKSLVRFGMFPAAKMTDESVSHIDGRLLAVALMDCAERTGGMIA